MLPKVLALFNAFKDDEFLKDAKQKSKPISSSPRTDAAGKLLQKLKGDGGLRDIIVQMERMCEGTTSIIFPNLKMFSLNNRTFFINLYRQ